MLFSYLVSILLLALPNVSHQMECGQRLGNGSVICSVGIHGNSGDFNYSLCTHAGIVTYIRCGDDSCYPVNDSDFGYLLKEVQVHPSTKLGLDITVEDNFRNFISTRIRRLNTRNEVVKFMSERNLTFIYFDEATRDNNPERNILKFVKEIAGTLHDRGWHIGLKVNINGSGGFKPAYNFEELSSSYVDWFAFSVRKTPYAGKELWPLTPLTATNKQDYEGTTKYWIERTLKLLKPKCVVLIIDIVGIKYTAKESVIEPGPGSKVHVARFGNTVNTKVLLFVELCYKVHLDSNCQEHWHDESSTPWAACRNEFFSYEDKRSVRAKTDLARQYHLGGMSIYLDRKDICEERNPILLVSAMQGIRNDIIQAQREDERERA